MLADPLLANPPGPERIVPRKEYGNVGFSAHPQVNGTGSVNLRLRAASRCVDRGVLIRGVNEDYYGKAPDLGALEYVK